MRRLEKEKEREREGVREMGRETAGERAEKKERERQPERGSFCYVSQSSRVSWNSCQWIPTSPNHRMRGIMQRLPDVKPEPRGDS